MAATSFPPTSFAQESLSCPTLRTYGEGSSEKCSPAGPIEIPKPPWCRFVISGSNTFQLYTGRKFMFLCIFELQWYLWTYQCCNSKTHEWQRAADAVLSSLHSLGKCRSILAYGPRGAGGFLVQLLCFTDEKISPSNISYPLQGYIAVPTIFPNPHPSLPPVVLILSIGSGMT